MWRNSYSPYARGERQAPDNREMVDVSEIARAQGAHYPVLLTQELAGALKPGEFLSAFGIRFDKRVRNVLAVLKTQMNPRASSRYYDEDDTDYPDEACAFPFVVLHGPDIEEKLIRVRAFVERDEEGEPVVRLAGSFREAA